VSDVDTLLDAHARLRAMARERATASPSTLAELSSALDTHRGPLAKGALREEWFLSHDDRLQAA
jgi:hypothetical protein